MSQPADSRSRTELARRAWSHVFRVGERQMESLGEAMQRLGLTPVMGHFLDELVKMPPGPMSALVVRMDVDPGWVTDIVDRLEARGDVVRRPSAEDRRVKIIEVTPAGRRTWEHVQDLMYNPPPAVRDLPEKDLRELLRIGEQISAAAEREQPPAEPTPAPEPDHRQKQVLLRLDRSRGHSRRGRHRSRRGSID